MRVMAKPKYAALGRVMKDCTENEQTSEQSLTSVLCPNRQAKGAAEAEINKSKIKDTRTCSIEEAKGSKIYVLHPHARP